MSETKVLVAAIDFGSSGAGYAFSFSHQYHDNPIDVNTSVWSDSCNAINTKIPTVLLFDADQKFHSFGYEAEDKYEEVCYNNGQNNWYYYKGFKMKLYTAVEKEDDIREDFEIPERCGKSMSAKKVFSTAIKYLKDHLVTELRRRNLLPIEDMVHWVISVPAIWNDSCKQFMREAAENADIQSDKFSIVYEPEAASVYARNLPVDRFIGKNQGVVLKTFDIGRKFIVLDAGGGTVDISTQEVDTDGKLKIVHRVSGGPWGGETINKKFFNIISTIIGMDIIIEFKERFGVDFLQLLRDFERKKKLFRQSTDESQEPKISIPVSLVDIIQEMKGLSFMEMIEKSDYSDSFKFIRKYNKLKLSSKFFRELFEETVAKIVDEIKTILQHERCIEVSAIMMVGGFSESEILQTAVKEAFSNLEVFIPIEGSLSVLKGAVIYGHNPNVVSSRICNHTYGVKVFTDFNPEIHSINKFQIIDGAPKCVDIFRNMFIIDEVVKVGESRERCVSTTYLTPEMQFMRSEEIEVKFYVSDKPDPFYTTDEGCQEHAVLHVNPPNDGIWPQIVNGKIEVQVAGTEMIGTFIFDDTDERTAVRFEFLPSKRTGASVAKKRLFDPFELDI